jgi:hypothetical protein
VKVGCSKEQRASLKDAGLKFSDVKPSNVSRFLRWGGVLLFVVSFFIPDFAAGAHAKLCAGAYALAYAGLALYGAFFPPASGWSARDVVGFIALTISVLSNLSVFLKLPRRWAWIGIVAPWAVLVCFPGGLVPVLKFVPLYVWAIGIGMIHGANYVAGVVPRVEEPPEAALSGLSDESKGCLR